MTKDSGWNWRSVISFSLLFSAVVLILSGIALLIAPSGRIARETGWQILGFDREGWILIHDLFGFFFILLTLIHLWLNYRALLAYLRDRARNVYRLRAELLTALLLSGVVFLVAALRLLPL